MDALINGLMVPVMYLGRLWLTVNVMTGLVALALYGLTYMVKGHNPVLAWWWGTIVLGPPKLLLARLGPKPKKKKRGSH